MPKSITCVYNGKVIPVGEALDIKGNKPTEKGMFTCPKCGTSVRPHRESKPGKQFQAAHFEHFQNDESCSMSKY